MSDWVYSKKKITQEIVDNYAGFVYIITNLTNNKQYIGKKLFKFKRKKQNKGKYKKVLIESDWREYYGSCNELKKDIELLGKENFKREILYFCINKSEMNYKELKLQMKLDVVLKPDNFYNNFVGTRISANGLKHMLKNNGGT